MTRVLAVDDSLTQVQRLQADLTAAGFDVTLSSSGAEALRALDTDRFDLVVSDVVMPEIDGYELCRRIKAREDTASLPVVLLTSLSDPLDVVNGLESGADNFIRKPYQAEQLVSRLKATLHNRELRLSRRMQMGVRLSFLDREFEITAERQQILDLLISTFEELVMASRQVRAREDELARAHGELSRQLQHVDLERSRLQSVVDAVPVPLYVADDHGLVSHLNQLAADLFGAPAEKLVGQSADQLGEFLDVDGNRVSSAELPLARALKEREPVSAGSAFDLLLAGEEDRPVPVMLQASPIIDHEGRTVGSVGTAQPLGALSRHDPLTGLPNRAAFLDHLAVVLDPCTSSGCALLLLELHRFEVVRAAHGDRVGNAVVAEVARRLREVFEPAGPKGPSFEALVAHLGGEQFGVVLSGLEPDALEPMRLARIARQRIADPENPPEGVRVNVSVGVSVREASWQAPHLLAAAGTALRRAKATVGDRVQLLGAAASREAMERMDLESDLRSAVERGEIELHYQPEVDLVSGRLLGFEALARWRHAERGFVRPDVFISLAEESGLILPLGRHLLETACRQARAWGEAHSYGGRLTVAVNVSALQIRPEFVDDVVSILDKTGLEPSRLYLEVTETATMQDPQSSIPILDRLRDHGIRLSLDDFGTGYSSLAYLSRFRFDQLKLDRSFVAGLAEGGNDLRIAQSIITLGHSLEVPVIAEGIEHRDQLELLRSLGCDQGQGYLFAKPLDGTEMAQFLAAVEKEGGVVAAAVSQEPHGG